MIMKNGKQRTAIVAGGAGFIGSHLCDALLADGFRVLCLDNLRTGRRQNLQHLARDARFDLVEGDVIAPPPASLARGSMDLVFNLACAASPPQYQSDPEHTMLT